MQLSILPILSSMLALGSAVTLSYDTGYDQSARPLTSLACSDGQNGLITKHGWHTQGQIPRFPYIGGAQAIAGWNSKECGGCWKLEYKGKSINILAVDHAASGFNVGKKAMDALTGNKASQLGRVDVKATKVAAKNCGL
ncbi:Cerato-platanin [Sarocladium strictum]